MTLISVFGTFYMSLTVSFNFLGYISVNYLPKTYLHYLLPLLSIVAAFNRFSAIALWAIYDRIWTWKHLCIYIGSVFLVSFVISFAIHVDFHNLNAIRNLTVDRFFKASAYMVAFAFEVAAVIYRVYNKESIQIDKVNVTLLIPSIISTVIWLINCASNIAFYLWGKYDFLVVTADATVVCGFVLPLVYLFMTNRKLTVILFEFYRIHYFRRQHAIGQRNLFVVNSQLPTPSTVV